MLITRKILAGTAFASMTLLSACAPIKTKLPFNQVPQQPLVDDIDLEGMKYPGSRLIYKVCHERWLRNGFKNYTFNIEEGSYDSGAEVQSGKFTQLVVANGKVSQSASCQLKYYGSGASCDQNTRKSANHGVAIDHYFERWAKNPSLYQSCHPVLGYPTGYGNTYGSRNRRVDASDWLLISSVVPRRHAQGSMPIQAAEAETRVASPSRQRQQKTAEFASVTDLAINVLSSNVLNDGKNSKLESEFTITNKTAMPAVLGIKSWLLDESYKRYPLNVSEGSEEGGVHALKVDAHSQLSVSYQAEGLPVTSVKAGKRSVAMLEIISADGVKVNLTLPNQ